VMLATPRPIASVLRQVGKRQLAISVPRLKIYSNILETIGETPVVKLDRLAPPGVNLYAKLEYFNPSGSIKDRAAISMIEEAERSGKLKPGGTVIEATSGNQGIAMAFVCAKKGYKFVSCMAEVYSVERRKIMRMYGAKVVVTPRELAGAGMVAKARELAEAHGWFFSGQFENEAQVDGHASTTGPEILKDFAGRPLDYFVTGYGSGGTFTGAAKVIKTARKDVKIVLAEPEGSEVIGSGIEQKRNADHTPHGTHPAWNAHVIQGWVPSFIPWLVQLGIDKGLADRLISVSAEESDETARQLAALEAIQCGTSGGATMAAALKLCKEVPSGSTVLAMIPDTGERYLSMPLFDPIDADMNDDELAISRSTPSAQLSA